MIHQIFLNEENHNEDNIMIIDHDDNDDVADNNNNNDDDHPISQQVEGNVSILKQNVWLYKIRKLYINKCKLDGNDDHDHDEEMDHRIARMKRYQQIQSSSTWSMVWKNNISLSESFQQKFASSFLTSSSEPLPTSLSFTPTYTIDGQWIWSNSYISFIFHVQCCWDGSNSSDIKKKKNKERKDDDDKKKKKKKESKERKENDADGNNDTIPSQCIWFQCRLIDIQFVTINNTNDKKSEKIHDRMIERYSKDDYVKKILTLLKHKSHKHNENDIDNNNDISCILCEASIMNNVKRVYCDYDISEMIRRTIYTTSDTTYDIFDLLCHIIPPFNTLLSNNNASDNVFTITMNDMELLQSIEQQKMIYKLQLLILEDAIFDVCEKDDEIDDDVNYMKNTLHITNATSTNTGNGTDETAATTATSTNAAVTKAAPAVTKVTEGTINTAVASTSTTKSNPNNHRNRGNKNKKKKTTT